MPLCDTFQSLSTDTWNWLRDTARKNQWPGEESITDNLMRKLLAACPGQVVARKFNRMEEGGTTGADWVMWLCSKSGGVGLRIQAKLISKTLDRYSSLWYKSQFDLLLADAKKYGLYPMYCFYSFWEQATPLPWWCGTLPPHRVDLLGCGLASAYSLSSLRGSREDTLARVASHIWPWSCLVCCTGYVAGGDLVVRR